jgi:hypothetical protein
MSQPKPNRMIWIEIAAGACFNAFGNAITRFANVLGPLLLLFALVLAAVSLVPDVADFFERASKQWGSSPVTLYVASREDMHRPARVKTFGPYRFWSSESAEENCSNARRRYELLGQQRHSQSQFLAFWCEPVGPR